MNSPYDGKDDITREEKHRTPSETSSTEDIKHQETFAAHRSNSDAVRKASVAALLRNPLMGLSEQQVISDVDRFVDEKGLYEYRETFRKGAMMARVGQRTGGFEQLTNITEADKDLLRHEEQHRWHQPLMLYFLVVLCAGSAIVQGMDQTAVNGAQVGYP
jgi:hypothetical protein